MQKGSTMKPAQFEAQEPVAWGFQNTAITGSNRWMMLREEVPADDQYNGALWTPLYTTPPAQQEPVAYCYVQKGTSVDILTFDDAPDDAVDGTIFPLYTTPPQRTWTELTDDEVYRIAFELEGEQVYRIAFEFEGGHWRKIVDAIEAKIKEKNT